MNAVRFQIEVDEIAVRTMPALRPMLGQRVEVIALQAESESEGSLKSLTLNDLLERRVDCPPGAGPLSEEDIQRAIIQGALGGNT